MAGRGKNMLLVKKNRQVKLELVCIEQLVPEDHITVKTTEDQQ